MELSGWMPLPVSTRRDVLITTGSILSSGLAGCNSREAAQESPSSPDESISPSKPDTPEPVTMDDFEFTARVVQQFTESHPAQIEFRLRNASSSTLRFQAHPFLPYPGFIARKSDDARLILVPENDRGVELVDSRTDIDRYLTELVPSSPIDGCWKIDLEYWDSTGAPAFADAADIESKGSISETYTILDGDYHGPCSPAGDYESSTKLEVLRSSGNSSQAVEFTLEVILSLENDRDLEIKLLNVQSSESPAD